MAFLDELKEQFPHVGNGLARGQLSTIGVATLPHNNPWFTDHLRSHNLENIGFQISDNPMIHKRIKEDAIAMNRKSYEFLICSPELLPYYVHNIFRDIIGVEKLYDYDEPPLTKVNVPDLRIASVYIENFKFVMADQASKISYKVNKVVSLKDGKTEATVELILLDY